MIMSQAGRQYGFVTHLRQDGVGVAANDARRIGRICEEFLMGGIDIFFSVNWGHDSTTFYVYLGLPLSYLVTAADPCMS